MYKLIPALALFVTPALAQENQTAIFGWTGTTDIGFANATGNSENSAFSADLGAKRDWQDWAVSFDFEGRTSEDDGNRSQERYLFGAQGDRKLDDVSYLFASADYVIDKFSGFDFQFTPTVGYGRTFWAEPVHGLKGQLGIGARISETDDDAIPANDTTTEFVVRPELDYYWNINENVTFNQHLEAGIGTEFTILESESSVESKLSEQLYLKAGFNVIHTTNVPANTEQTDTFTGISLGYKF